MFSDKLINMLIGSEKYASFEGKTSLFFTLNSNFASTVHVS